VNGQSALAVKCFEWGKKKGRGQAVGRKGA
jgi:hypothetical protein